MPCHRRWSWRPCDARALCPLKPWWAVLGSRYPSMIIIIIVAHRQWWSVATTRSRALDHSALMLYGVPSPICWIQDWHGRPRVRRQVVLGRDPVRTSAANFRARWAGVRSLSLTTWPNRELRRQRIVSSRLGRFVAAIMRYATGHVQILGPTSPTAPRIDALGCHVSRSCEADFTRTC